MWRSILFCACELCFFSFASAKAQMRSDHHGQITIEMAFKGDPNGLRHASTELKLDHRLNIASAFADGTLEQRVKALEPFFHASKGAQTELGTVIFQPKAYVALGTIWDPERLGNILSIPVCWINPSAATARGQELTRIAVSATWEHHGNVRFVNWEQCNTGDKGIRIVIDERSPTSMIGNLALDAPEDSMNLSFVPGVSDCPWELDDCIFSHAVHEFGHALGFIHEDDSPDAIKWCTNNAEQPNAKLKAKMITNWDRFSVMSFCEILSKKRVQLSDCDIAAYQKIYGIPKAPPYKPKCKVK